MKCDFGTSITIEEVETLWSKVLSAHENAKVKRIDILLSRISRIDAAGLQLVVALSLLGDSRIHLLDPSSLLIKTCNRSGLEEYI